MKKFLLLLFLVTPLHAENTLTQISAIDALMAGVYDGKTTLADVRKSGNFGLGTFNGIDGEMVLLDGNFYQFGAAGKVKKASAEMKTPFAVATFFQPERRIRLEPNAKLSEVEAEIGKALPSKNLFYALRIEGSFSLMKTRAVKKQEKPYRPLIETVKEQTVFDIPDTAGTIVGFYSPPFARGFNVPGFHFHYLDRNRSLGGHVLDFLLKDGEVEIMTMQKFTVLLPDDPEFLGADLSRDRQQEVRKVEE